MTCSLQFMCVRYRGSLLHRRIHYCLCIPARGSSKTAHAAGRALKLSTEDTAIPLDGGLDVCGV